MKQTKQKTLILNAVLKREDHPTAQMIYNEIKEECPNISLATVYRNLNTFAENGKIRKIAIPNAKDRFDYMVKTHDHAVCRECGKVINAPSDIVRKPRSLKLDGFKVEDVSILYSGICEECQQKHKQRS